MVGQDENLTMRAYDPALDTADPGWRDDFYIPPFTGDPFTEEGRQKTAKIYTDFLLEK